MSGKMQNECNQHLSDQYFIGNNVDFDLVWPKVAEIFHNYPKQKIYIGITHHPCGRFTGDYGTLHLPSKFELKYESNERGRSIDEQAHSNLYSKMFLICSNNSLKKIQDIEIKTLEYARKYFPDRVDNSSQSGGGEGNIPESEYYFFYACISLTLM